MAQVVVGRQACPDRSDHFSVRTTEVHLTIGHGQRAIAEKGPEHIGIKRDGLLRKLHGRDERDCPAVVVTSTRMESDFELTRVDMASDLARRDHSNAGALALRLTASIPFRQNAPWVVVSAER